MLDVLRDRMASHLATHHRCVVGGGGIGGAVALPVPYRPHGLAVECALPHWADVTYRLEEDPRVAVVIIPAAGEEEWLQIRGVAEPVAAPEWAGLLPEPPTSVAPEDLYRAVRIWPLRMDILNDRGTRVTLELE